MQNYFLCLLQTRPKKSDIDCMRFILSHYCYFTLLQGGPEWEGL